MAVPQSAYTNYFPSVFFQNLPPQELYPVEQFNPASSILLFFLRNKKMSIDLQTQEMFSPVISLMVQEKFLEAEEILKKFINLNQANTFAYILLGDALCCQKRFLEAEPYLAHAATLDPNNDVIHLILATAVLYGRSNPSDAQQHLLRAIQCNPSNDYAYASLANILYDQNFFPEAKACLQKVFQINPQNSLAYAIYGSILCTERNLVEAARYLNRAIELNPADDSAFTNLGTLFCDLKRFPEARQCFNEALRLNPENISALTALTETAKIF